MSEFKSLVLGGLSIPYYAAAFFFCFLAIILSMYAGSQKRDPKSSSTPELFSWHFLIWDNAKRIAAGLILMFVIFRFAVPAIGKALTMETAFGIGFGIAMGLDQVIGYLKKKFDLLQMDREKFNTKP
jgi:hypothetical protein